MPTNSHIPNSFLVNSICFYKPLSISIKCVLSMCVCAKVIKRDVVSKWPDVKPHRYFAVHVVRISMVDCLPFGNARCLHHWDLTKSLAFNLSSTTVTILWQSISLTATVNTAAITSKMSARFTESTRYDSPQTWQWTGKTDTSWKSWRLKNQLDVTSYFILFNLFCAQHVSDINISIFRSLRLCWWITTSVVLFSVRCVLEIWCCWYLVVFVLQA